MEQNWRFIIEWLITPVEAHMHGVKEVIYSGRTSYQYVDIVDTYSFGKCLFLDGKLQSSAYDEYIYHESLIHPAMIAHPAPRRVAVIGGGEGATIREVLRYEEVDEVVMVDIDEELVKLCEKYLPEWSRGAFKDPRLNLRFENGRSYLERCEEEFDVIVLDLTDPTPNSPSVYLYTKEFYEIVREKLSENGIMVTQATSLRYSPRSCGTILNTVSSVFPIARIYHAPMESFMSWWGFVIGSKSVDPLELPRNHIAERLGRIRGELSYYNDLVHFYMFKLPKPLLNSVSEVKGISTDEEPVYIAA